MSVGYDNILTSTLHVVKLREIIAVAAADNYVRGCNYLALVTHGENLTPSTYIIKKRRLVCTIFCVHGRLGAASVRAWDSL